MANTFVKGIVLELKLDGVNWTDVSTDLRASHPVSVDYGISSHRPDKRVASIGRLRFALDNTDHNSGGLQGYYSPGHANLRTGFDLNIGVRLGIRAGTFYNVDEYGDFYYGADPWYRFVGKLRDIRVVPGQKSSRYVDCTAYDFMHEMSRHKMSLLTVSEAVLSGTFFQSVIGNMNDAPTGSSYDIGQDTLPYAGDDLQEGQTSASTAAKKIALSEFGYVYVKGDNVAGGKLVFEDRHHRIGSTSKWTIDDDDIVDMEVDRPISQVYNKIRTISHPREVGGSPEVLWTLQTTMEIKAGETETLIGRYSDPNQTSVKIAGKDAITPVADTDFKFGSTQGGGANDKNGDLSITVTEGATSVRLALQNTSGSNGYVNLLQIRGTAIRTFEPVETIAEDATSQTAYDERELKMDLVYQDSPITAQERANALLAAFKDPQTFIRSISLISNTANIPGRALAVGDIGDRITLSESVTGISAKDYAIHKVQLQFIPPDIMRGTYLLVLSSTLQAWLLGDVGFSELGDTTILGGSII